MKFELKVGFIRDKSFSRGKIRKNLVEVEKSGQTWPAKAARLARKGMNDLQNSCSNCEWEIIIYNTSLINLTSESELFFSNDCMNIISFIPQTN